MAIASADVRRGKGLVAGDGAGLEVDLSERPAGQVASGRVGTGSFGATSPTKRQGGTLLGRHVHCSISLQRLQNGHKARIAFGSMSNGSLQFSQ